MTLKTKRDYIIDGINTNIRRDGRPCLMRRPLEIKLGVLPQADGSASLTVFGSSTNIIASIRCDLVVHDNSVNTNGSFECSTELFGPALRGSSDFVANKEQSRNVSTLVDSHLRPSLLKMLKQHSDALNMNSSTKSKVTWSVNLDLLVLNSDGSLIENCVIAAIAAIRSARIPKINAVKSNTGEVVDWDLHPTDYVPLCTDVAIPYLISLSKIGSMLVVDTDLAEEDCEDAKITVSIDSNSDIHGLQSEGVSALPQNVLTNAVIVSTGVLADIDNVLKSVLKKFRI